MQEPKEKANHAMLRFQAYAPLLLVYSALSIVYVIIVMTGVGSPFNPASFESSAASQIVTLLAGVLGLAASLSGLNAAKTGNMGVIKLCAVMGFVMVALYCVVMVLGNGHKSPSVWILLVVFSIIPATFGGVATQLAIKGAKA